jgi:hypothetical protein
VDAATGSHTLSALVVAKAIAAIDTVAGFSANDGPCVGTPTPLDETKRVRVAADLYAILMMGAAQAQFGAGITAYQSASGTATLSSSDFPGILSRRIDQAPGTAGLQELKEWMVLLQYLKTVLGGTVPASYASTANFTQFGSFGASVTVRNATYPLANIGQLMGTLGALQAAP